MLSFWSEQDPDGLESAARQFGIGAAAAQAASEALQFEERSSVLVLLFGLVLLAWFTLGAVRALVLAYALAWQLKPPRIRRPHRAVAVFNGLFLLAILSSVGEAWLEAEIGFAALLGLAVTTALTARDRALRDVAAPPPRDAPSRARPGRAARRGRAISSSRSP